MGEAPLLRTISQSLQFNFFDSAALQVSFVEPEAQGQGNRARFPNPPLRDIPQRAVQRSSGAWWYSFHRLNHNRHRSKHPGAARVFSTAKQTTAMLQCRLMLKGALRSTAGSLRLQRTPPAATASIAAAADRTKSSLAFASGVCRSQIHDSFRSIQYRWRGGRPARTGSLKSRVLSRRGQARFTEFLRGDRAFAKTNRTRVGSFSEAAVSPVAHERRVMVLADTHTPTTAVARWIYWHRLVG